MQYQSTKGMDQNGWQIQLALGVWPKLERQWRDGYKVQGFFRALNELSKKSDQFARIVQDSERMETYPKGRLKHLAKQIKRLDTYVGGGDGRQSEATL